MLGKKIQVFCDVIKYMKLISLSIKINWTQLWIPLLTVYGRLSATGSELNGCNRDGMARKAQDIYYLLYKKFTDPWARNWARGQGRNEDLE